MEVEERPLDDRVQRYQQKMTAELLTNIHAADSAVMNWQLSAASYLYQKAQEIAHYHLHREDIVDWVGNRLKYVADNYLLNDEENKGVPDLDGLEI